MRFDWGICAPGKLKSHATIAQKERKEVEKGGVVLSNRTPALTCASGLVLDLGKAHSPESHARASE